MKIESILKKKHQSISSVKKGKIIYLIIRESKNKITVKKNKKKLKDQIALMKIQMKALNFQMRSKPLKRHNSLNILTMAT